eukprot:6334414-Pyramimonas_sp.AAC.1
MAWVFLYISRPPSCSSLSDLGAPRSEPPASLVWGEVWPAPAALVKPGRQGSHRARRLALLAGRGKEEAG